MTGTTSWRRLTAEDLGYNGGTKLPPGTPIRKNEIEGNTTLGDYADLYLPGDYPFLLGMQAFWTIEVPDKTKASPVTWNVTVPVVDLIKAATDSEALTILADRLRAAGFDVYEGSLPDGANAFESEDLA